MNVRTDFNHLSFMDRSDSVGDYIPALTIYSCVLERLLFRHFYSQCILVKLAFLFLCILNMGEKSKILVPSMKRNSINSNPTITLVAQIFLRLNFLADPVEAIMGNSHFLCLCLIMISASFIPFQCKWTYRDGKGISLHSSISLMENHLNIVSNSLFISHCFNALRIAGGFYCRCTKNVQAFEKAHRVNENGQSLFERPLLPGY